MKLLRGQRLLLDSDEKFARVHFGKVDVYAVTRDASSFRQIYLRSVNAGGAVFPSLDDFETIDIILHSVEDADIELIAFDQCDPIELKSLMRTWFGGLIEISWVKFLADSGDDMLSQWRDGSIFEQADSFEDLRAEFEEHEKLLSMMLGVRFQSEDKRLSQRLQVRARNKQKLMDNSLGNLLGEDDLLYEETTSYDQRLEAANLVVRSVAHSLNLPVDNIALASDITDKLDQVNLLRRLAQKGNMHMRFVTLEKSWHKTDGGAMIGYFGEKRELAALIPQSPSRYRLVTKNIPDGRTVDDALAAQISKDAFECYAGFANRVLNMVDVFKFMFKQCWKVDYATVIGMSLLAGLLPLLTPIVTETILADIIPILDRRGLATVTQVMAVSAFTLAVLTMIRSVAVIRISGRISMNFEAALFNRMLSLPIKFFRRYTVGDLANRINGLNEAKKILTVAFIDAGCNFIFSFWSLLLMCYYSLTLTAISLGIWLIYLVLTVIFYRRFLLFRRKLVSLDNKTSGIVQQIFVGLSKFRVQGAEEQAYHLWANAFGQKSIQFFKCCWQKNYIELLTTLQPLLLAMLLYYVTDKMFEEAAMTGVSVNLTAAELMAFQAAYTAFNATLVAVTPLLKEFFKIQPQIENLRPFFEELPEHVSDKPDAGKLSGALTVAHLSFAYEGGKDILNDLNFNVEAGENVAIVGKSGCGKSTLIRLLLGFETPKSGAIYYDNQDLKDVNMTSVRSQMGVVLQNGELMTGNILINIIGTNKLTEDDAWAAAEAAGIADDIAMMPMGMYTVISEGSSNISGGQRQRILIARALVTKPSLLIFDEATSALDNRSQAIVTESIDKLNATRIVIAHRLSTIRNCDRIIVLDGGRVAETGTFEELVELGGLFTDLVKRQEM